MVIVHRGWEVQHDSRNAERSRILRSEALEDVLHLIAQRLTLTLQESKQEPLQHNLHKQATSLHSPATHDATSHNCPTTHMPHKASILTPTPDFQS